MTFETFKLSSPIQEAIAAMGFETPTPVQEKAIPLILENKDITASAQTGTGKTAAYLLPLLEKLNNKGNHTINTLVIVPTRELAIQVDNRLQGLAYFTDVSYLPVYGGTDSLTWEQEKKALTEGADIIVATPGRLISHLNLGYVNMSHLQHLVLDEADRMLDMGFYDDIMSIIKKLPKKRQTLLFSATFPPKIRQLAHGIMNNPVNVNIAIAQPAEGIHQAAYPVYENQKYALIKHLLTSDEYESVLVFSATKSNVKKMNTDLRSARLDVDCIHSDLEQSQREEVMRNFGNKKVKILVATDIVARGIDIVGISLVVNYDVPGDAEDYVHRIGRTARADATGKAITFITPGEKEKFLRIEKLIKKEVPKLWLPKELGEGPKWATMLNRSNTQKKRFGNKNRNTKRKQSRKGR